MLLILLKMPTALEPFFLSSAKTFKAATRPPNSSHAASTPACRLNHLVRQAFFMTFTAAFFFFLTKNRSFSTCSVKLQKAEVDEAHEGGLQNVHTFIDLPETHQMLQDTCKQFAETELWPIAGEIDK